MSFFILKNGLGRERRGDMVSSYAAFGIVFSHRTAVILYFYENCSGSHDS